MDRDWLAQRLQDGASYEAIAREAACSASKVAWWAKRHGLASAHVERHAARGPIEREVLAGLVARELSVREMAAELDRSPTTVRHWLKRFGLGTPTARRRVEGARAAADAAVEPTLDCPVHGPTRHVARGAGYRCATCRSAFVTERRRRVKRILLIEAGGECLLCGYDRCAAALHFHHVDPRTKSFSLGAVGTTLSLDAAREEARKCVVLCANCHAEVESGELELPLECPGPGSMLGSAVLDRG
jgi:transposase-like protein